ncbi:AbrB/MazE/SpoVT family DNA-binding domain-containing protein [Thermococcus thermotolerans]|uniref:AbrB/MazE/SpoVT family DNA-binding domain-containing protein n=1 Tax=Thermococcus thermotolerans TaxID=2969672 RepID=UPI002157B0EA|nr:AbrB/MazE/SpoVT family DNA-binding domain-containing protein [Thermococcus thermotolerans]
MTAEIVKVDKNGRIYLPASLRKKFGVTSFYVEERGDEIVLIPVRKRIGKYYGIFRGENLSPEEIDRLIEEETEKLLRDEL